MLIISYIIILIVLIEFFLLLNIKFLQSKIPWIITEKDEYPSFKKDKIKKFLNKTHDPLLGWNWKPNTKHEEKINNKRNNIFFGKLGERKSTLLKNKSFKFASFGDSFVFCRYVKNNQTWQNYLSKSSKSNGLNFGVGNYGLDQIYLKYSSTNIPKSIKTVYIGFVPETLSRCLSSWKHYQEFNNIYAFKPKFNLKNKKLILRNNPIQSMKDFNKIEKLINELKKSEFFYEEKFLKYKLSFPYLISFMKNIKHNYNLILFSFLKILNINQNKIYDFIINTNCKKNDYYFTKKNNTDLIYKLLLSIDRISKKKNHKLVFLIFPQKYDLSIKNKAYQKFFQRMKNKFNVIDFTEIFLKDDVNKLYLEGKYGGHLTSYGNKVVAKTILKKRLIN